MDHLHRSHSFPIQRVGRLPKLPEHETEEPTIDPPPDRTVEGSLAGLAPARPAGEAAVQASVRFTLSRKPERGTKASAPPRSVGHTGPAQRLDAQHRAPIDAPVRKAGPSARTFRSYHELLGDIPGATREDCAELAEALAQRLALAGAGQLKRGQSLGDASRWLLRADWRESIESGRLNIADLLAVLQRSRDLHPAWHVELPKRLVEGFEKVTAQLASTVPTVALLLRPGCAPAAATVQSRCAEPAAEHAIGMPRRTARKKSPRAVDRHHVTD